MRVSVRGQSLLQAPLASITPTTGMGAGAMKEEGMGLHCHYGTLQKRLPFILTSDITSITIGPFTHKFYVLICPIYLPNRP